MRCVSARAAIALVAALVIISAAGCASAQPTPTPQAVAQATWQPPTPTPWPTLTPTPKPTVTPTPMPSPTPSDAGGLLRQLQGTSQSMKSARGSVEMIMEGKDEKGKPQSVNINMDFEQNDPDMHMTMKMSGPDAAAAAASLFNMEFIVKDKVGYMKIGDQWSSFPGGESEFQSQTQMVNLDEMESFLKDVSELKSAGRRTVKNIECDVLSFKIPQSKMTELLNLGGALPEGVSEEDMKFGDFTGEVAIGVSDKILHQMVYKMSGYAKSAPENDFKMTFIVTIWDVNSPDVVIKAPENVKPIDFNIPSPTANRKP